MASHRLSGKRAVITGGGSGIGAASASRLVCEGAAVAVLDARLDAAQAVAKELTTRGGRAIAVECNVAQEDSVASATQLAVDFLGDLDTVVASAGIVRSGDTHEMSLPEWETVIGVNLTGTFLTLKHSLPHLISAGGGSIVTIGSVASLVAAGRASSYDASKGGVLQLTKAIAVEYADRRIRANCVCPGITTTGLSANSKGLHGNTPASSAPGPSSRLRIPMDRAADPSEIAGVVAFLCSLDASFMTGASLAVDGGYTAI